MFPESVSSLDKFPSCKALNWILENLEQGLAVVPSPHLGSTVQFLQPFRLKYMWSHFILNVSRVSWRKTRTITPALPWSQPLLRPPFQGTPSCDIHGWPKLTTVGEWLQMTPFVLWDLGLMWRWVKKGFPFLGICQSWAIFSCSNSEPSGD